MSALFGLGSEGAYASILSRVASVPAEAASEDPFPSEAELERTMFSQLLRSSSVRIELLVVRCFVARLAAV